MFFASCMSNSQGCVRALRCLPGSSFRATLQPHEEVLRGARQNYQRFDSTCGTGQIAGSVSPILDRLQHRGLLLEPHVHVRIQFTTF